MPDTTNPPNDPIDPYENELSRRVGAYADRAVQPIDAAEIAHTTAIGSGRRTGAGRLFASTNSGRRIAWLGAGMVLVAAFGVFVGAGGLSRLTPTQSADAVAPTALPVDVRACTPNDVDARILRWEGAAGSRIATVELRQVGPTPCTIDPLPQPWLADGKGRALIVGKAGGGGPIQIAPGDVVSTLVDAGNYCGPDPVAPVTVAFTQGEAIFVATALNPTDLTGVPPCNSTNGTPGSIQMQPFRAGAPAQ